MPFLPGAVARLAGDRRAGVALAFGVMALPLTLAIGLAIDYARVVEFRTALQQVTDSAALAGAGYYAGPNGNNASQAYLEAAYYLYTGLASLPQNLGSMTLSNAAYVTVPSTGSLPTTLPSSLGWLLQLIPTTTPAGFQVTVSAQTSIRTIFMGSLAGTMTVKASSTALSKTPYASFAATPGYTGSGATDLDAVYWYYVPVDGSVPPDTALNPIWTSQQGSPSNVTPVPLSSTQAIGFALRNTVGSTNNPYGAAFGSVKTYYSHLGNPSNSSNGYTTANNPSNVNGIDGPTGDNCSLQASIWTQSSPMAAIPSPGVCIGYSALGSLATPSCSILGGNKLVFYFNDMDGSGTDDLGYNDMVFTYYCGSGAPPSASTATLPAAVLIQ